MIFLECDGIFLVKSSTKFHSLNQVDTQYCIILYVTKYYNLLFVMDNIVDPLKQQVSWILPLSLPFSQLNISAKNCPEAGTQELWGQWGELPPLQLRNRPPTFIEESILRSSKF